MCRFTARSLCAPVCTFNTLLLPSVHFIGYRHTVMLPDARRALHLAWLRIGTLAHSHGSVLHAIVGTSWSRDHFTRGALPVWMGSGVTPCSTTLLLRRGVCFTWLHLRALTPCSTSALVYYCSLNNSAIRFLTVMQY